MADPGAELYKMLAESNQRAKHCLKIGKGAAASIESRHQSMQQELEQLRGAIQEAGIGGDTASEDRYFELLRDFRSLHQSHALSQQLPDLPPEPVSDELQKALDYASLMLSVYRGGVLVKAAGADLASVIRRLERFDHPQAVKMVQQLRELSAG